MMNNAGEGYLKASPMPPARLVVCWMFFRISLLKLLLVRGCLDVVSLSRVLQSTVFFGVDFFSFGA